MLTNGKDSRWLQLEVCREFQRQRCVRNDNDCKFAHPSSKVEIIDGKVIACYDSIKERCNRETCKYFHPPSHLKEQLLINGRNHLALKNAMLHQMHLPMDPNNPTYLANLPSSVAAIATNPTVQTPSHQIGQQLPHSQLNTQQLVSQQQLALLAAYSAAAYSQAGSTLVAAMPNLTDLQAYNIITTLPPHSSAQQASGNQGSTANILSNSMLSNTNNSMVNQALMTNYILPGTSLPTHNSLKNNLVLNRQAIKLEICREFQRFACKRLEAECRYAHPPAHVHRTQDGSSVVVCSIFLKRGCTREQCRFFHPPSNLMDQVKQQQINQQQNYYNQQQLLTQHQLQQRAATMMLTNQSMSTNNASQSFLRRKRPRDSDEFLLGFPRVVPLTKRPALDKMLLPTNTYEHALALQPSFVRFTLPGPCVPRY